MGEFFLILYWGLADSGNICQLASCALAIAVAFLLFRRPEAFFLILRSFVLVHVFTRSLAALGLFQGIAGAQAYPLPVIVFYMITGGIFIALGGWGLYLLVRQRQETTRPLFRESPCWPLVWGKPVGGLLGLVSAICSMFGPLSFGASMNLQVMFVPGMLLRGIVFVLSSEVLRLWPILVVGAGYMVFQRSLMFRAFVTSRGNLFYMFFSILYIVLGGGLVILFGNGVSLQ